MRRAALVIAVLAIIIIAGCIQKIGAGSTQYLQDYRTGLQRVAIYSPNQTEECRQGTCVCMVCVNVSRTFATWWNSLAGGYCYFEKNCTQQKLSEIQGNNVSSSDTTRHFMFGQGPGFGSYAYANTHCVNSLGMAVQWLLGSNTSAYMKPDAVRTMCFLKKDVIPVYILYSNNSDVNVTRAREIGHILGRERNKDLTFIYTGEGPVGPVIVITEMNFDISKAPLVAQQVRAIDDECNRERSSNRINCFIAVAPKMNDFAALDAVMRELGSESNRVDLVAFGVDHHFANTCSGPAIVQQALNFSSYALYNHSKPTIIPYVLFDTNGTDAARTCNWSETSMIAAYGSFDLVAINALQKRGVIGIAPYAFNATGGGGITNPLNCTDCGIGKTQARLRSWYSSCQRFYNISSRGQVAKSALSIYFGNESSTICNANTDISSILLGTSFSGRDIMSPQQQEARPPLPMAFKCDACLVANASRPANTIFPSLGNIAGITNTVYCSAYPEIDEWASARNLDPMLVRAFVLTESGFNPCSAAKVCSQACLSSACTPGCFPADLSGNSECYGNAYDEMSDPRTGADSCNANLSSGYPPFQINGQIAFRWCAVGMMQSLEPPYTFWPANYHPEGVDGPFFDITERSGFWSSYFSGSGAAANDTRIPAFDLAKACDPYFNPFIAGHSVCVGTAKLASMLTSAEGWINAHRDQLGWAPDYDKDRLFAAYIAGNMYSGFWGSSYRAADHPRCSSSQSNGDCWAYGFAQSRIVNATYCASSNGSSDSRCENGHPKVGPNQNRPVDCYGFTDFFQYVDVCEKPYLSRQVDPGLGKLKAYLGLAAGCANNACPDVRLTANATETSIPPGGTYDIPQSNGTNSSGTPPPGGGT